MDAVRLQRDMARAKVLYPTAYLLDFELVACRKLARTPGKTSIQVGLTARELCDLRRRGIVWFNGDQCTLKTELRLTKVGALLVRAREGQP